MKKLTLKAYALKHKLSLFTVVKMTKSGEVQSETVHENGKDNVYIIIDEASEEKVNQAIVQEKNQEPYSLKKENARLKNEIVKLQEEIALLKNSRV